MVHSLQQIVNDNKLPLVMAILNVTPDSFYDGGKYSDEKSILLQVEKFIEEGASIIDVGGYSSRPNAKHISQKKELDRVIPIVKLLRKYHPNTLLSVDTFRSEVARQSIGEGAHIINDISAGNMDVDMFQTIAKLKVPYIAMHMQGVPQNMQQNPDYNNVTQDVLKFFKKKLQQLQELGVNDVTLDVGFGFGKTLEQNYQLLKELKSFKVLKKPLLVGVSRKSMLYKLLEIKPDDALNATSVAHTIALLNGANILRVHDVKETMEVIKIVNQYQKI